MHEKEQKIHGQERKIEEKERELHGIRLDNEAVCLKTFFSLLLVRSGFFTADAFLLLSSSTSTGLGQRGSFNGTRQRTPELQVVFDSWAFHTCILAVNYRISAIYKLIKSCPRKYSIFT